MFSNSDAAAFLLEVITSVEQNDRDDCIERLIDAIQKQQRMIFTLNLVYERAL